MNVGILIPGFADKTYEDEVSGCTATTAIIAHGKIYCVSLTCGDSI